MAMGWSGSGVEGADDQFLVDVWHGHGAPLRAGPALDGAGPAGDVVAAAGFLL